MGRGQELLDAARKADRSTVEKIIGQITKRSGPFPSIRRGPGVNYRDDNGYTPLHHACLNGHEDIVQLLLSADASPCHTDKAGATPLHMATFNGHSTVVAILLAHKNPPVNIDQLTLKHDTALLMASEFGHTDVVKMLLIAGADVTIQNREHLNALELAAQFDKKEVVKLLLEMRPQLIDQYRTPPARDGTIFRQTPLHLASKYGRDDVVWELLRAGMDPNLRTERGTPLHEAACCARDSVVRLLLSVGANLRIKDADGRTVMDMLNGYSEESTRSVRQAIQEFKSQRFSYDSDNDLPRFPVNDSPPAPMSLKSSPSFSHDAKIPSRESDCFEETVTNAYNSPSFKTPPAPVLTEDLSPDVYTDDLRLRTDSFLAKQKMLRKLGLFDESKDFINHCEVMSEIKSITQALTSNSTNGKLSVNSKKLVGSAVYENVVYHWPDLNRESQYVGHGKLENEYYKAEKVNSGLNSLERKSKTELHREQSYYHGAKINQVNTIKNYTNLNEENNIKTNQRPDVSFNQKIRRDTMFKEFDTAKHFIRQQNHETEYPLKKISSLHDFAKHNTTPKLERKPNYRHGIMDNEFKKSTLNDNPKKLIYSIFTPKSEIDGNFRRGTLDNGFKRNNTNNVHEFSYNIPKNNTLPKFYHDHPFKLLTIEKEFQYVTATNEKSQSDYNSLKKKPRPLPKPKVTNNISNAIEKLNYGQTDALSSLEQKDEEQYEDLNKFIANSYFTKNNTTTCAKEGKTDALPWSKQNVEELYEELNKFSPNSYPKNEVTSEPDIIYENLPSNMPDDMKAHMCSGDNGESLYLPMQSLRRSLRKTFSSDFIPSMDILKTDKSIYDRMSLSYDYIPIDTTPNINFRDNKLVRTLSIPDCFMFGGKPKSMHLRGGPGCRFKTDDYIYDYVLHPKALQENVHPFIKKKEKATPMPCYCSDNITYIANPDVNNSQVFLSCETMAIENEIVNENDYYTVEDFQEIHLFDNSVIEGSDNTPLNESIDSSAEQSDEVRLERKFTGIFKKKVNQIKQLVTDWTAPKTQELSNKNESFLSPSSSSLTKIHPQSFVKKLASKCLGLKSKFNSAPNISNNTEPEAGVVSKRLDQKSNTSNTLLIGNSKFFKILSKKEESGDMDCTDEFDTISLDRLGTLNRDSVVNRSNRSCPGFKTSLPNISENNEISDQESITESLVKFDSKCNEIENEAVNEASNINLNIFEPRNRFSIISNKSSGSANLINECYESYEFKHTELRATSNTIPRPLPRPNAATMISNEELIYENVKNIKSKPTPAARTHIPLKLPLDEVEKKVLYENLTLLSDKKPDPPKRTLFPNQIRCERLENDSSRSVSRSSTVSSDSMVDESNLEDILLSAKSKSFRHGQNASYYSGSYESKVNRTKSNASDSSEGSDVSAIENVDCSEDVDENKALYLSMTGTLPNKKSKDQENKKVLFRHKTFTNIEVDRNSVKIKDLPQWDRTFLKETLAHYHIRGTGHCIYNAPTVQEFMFIFNRDTLYKDVPPFDIVPNDKRDSYYETAICFCKPRPPKHHKSAEDLLSSGVSKEEDETVSIDLEALQNRREIFSTSFKCFCESGTCKFHSNRRESLTNIIVKFSAIKKSISTPDITLDHSPYSTSSKYKIPKNKSVPQNLEEPYAVVNIEDIVERNKSIERAIEQGYTLMSHPSTLTSHPSTLSSNSSARPYSIKDIAEVISLGRSTSTVSTVSTASDVYLPVQKSSSSEHSGHWSLQSCNSNVTIKSDLSYKSCLEESSDDGSDGTLHSDDDSDAETVKSDISTAKRPWLHSDSFRFGSNSKPEIETIVEENQSSFEDSKESMSSKFESGVSVEGSVSSSSGGEDDSGVPRCDTDMSLGASLERGSVTGGVRSGSGRRRWDDLEGTSEGDALSISSAASSCAPLHLMHHYEHSKVSPTPPKKPPRRNLSVSPTHANSPSSGYSYELRIHARSQDDLDDIQGAKHNLRHGRSVDHYESKLSYSEYEENHNSPRVIPIPYPRPSLKQRPQPVAITAMYENVAVKEQNPRRKLRRNIQPGETYEPRMTDRVRKYSNQERSSLESLLDDQSMNSPSDCERNSDGSRVVVPLSPSHYEQPPTPDHPPPSAKQAENSIHERIRPLSQEYKRRSTLRDSYTETEVSLLRAASAASVASGATDKSGNTDNCVEEYVCDVPFAGLFKGSTTTLDGIGLRPMPAERPKTLRKLKSVYDSSPTEAQHPLNNGLERSNGEEEVRRRSNTTSSNHSADKSLSILSPFDEQEEWAKISEIMASFGSKLVRESVFVSELEQEFTSRLGLSCSESSLSPSVASNLGLWLSGIGLHDYESLFLEGGYDDIDFVNGVLDENDLREMGIEEIDRQKILESSKQLPLKIAEISNNHNNNNISNKNQNESVDEWLRQINLEQYSDTFRKHLYVDMDRVRRIWEVELTAVLEINKAGHRKRILASVSGEQNGPINNHMEDINTDLNTLKNNIQQLKEEIKEKLPVNENLKPVPPPVVPTLMPPGGETLKRSKKNRPAPQPPRPSDLEIRAPSELLVGVPGALKTQWKHQPFVLVTGAVTYVANYLGSTVVKELRGTESTKKSIQKLKKTTKEPRDSPDIILSISYRGVKFLNTITRELVCEHEIRNIHCACQDADDLTHFAYITKDHSTRSHYCHVFRVATMDQATEVILTLGEAFEVAYQMALREQSNRTRVTQSLAKTPTHDPTTVSNKEKPIVNHGRSHSITEIKLNGHQLKIAPLPASLSNEDFQARSTDGSRSPRTPLLKAPIASTEEL